MSKTRVYTGIHTMLHFIRVVCSVQKNDVFDLFTATNFVTSLHHKTQHCFFQFCNKCIYAIVIEH